VLQIAFCFQKLLSFEETREILLEHPSVVLYLVDLTQDTNKEVRKTADCSLDMVMDSDEDWAVKIRLLKFEVYNSDWMQAVRGGAMGSIMYEDEVDDNSYGMGNANIITGFESEEEEDWDDDSDEQEQDDYVDFS